MICKFCGLNNADDATFCSRCGSPLRENRKPAAPASSNAIAMDDDKKTMRMETRPNKPKEGGVVMHSCGYPLLPGMTVCPNCHCKIGGESSDMGKQIEMKQVVEDKGGSLEKKTERFVAQDQNLSNAKKTERFVAQDSNLSNAKKTERFVAQAQNASNEKKTERFVKAVDQGEVVNKKTVDIRRMQTPVANKPEPELPPHCSLRPVARENEDAAKMVKQEFESAEVVLNRQNTDPENYTITSQQQALLIYENGKWYIEDRSAYKSTYVRATRRIELQDGDIVAMGDREFEFTI